MRWGGCDSPHYDVLWSECRYHLQFKFILLMIAILVAPSPACPALGPIHHTGPTHSLSGIWRTYFTRGCQIKTGEHRDDFNFNLLSSRCHAASWYRDKQWKYFSSHDLIVIIIRAIRITLWVPILLRPDSSRSSFILFLPLYLHVRNSSYSWISRLPDISSHIPSDIWVQECGRRIEMSDGRGWLWN